MWSLISVSRGVSCRLLPVLSSAPLATGCSTGCCWPKLPKNADCSLHPSRSRRLRFPSHPSVHEQGPALHGHHPALTAQLENPTKFSSQLTVHVAWPYIVIYLDGKDIPENKTEHPKSPPILHPIITQTWYHTELLCCITLSSCTLLCPQCLLLQVFGLGGFLVLGTIIPICFILDSINCWVFFFLLTPGCTTLQTCSERTMNQLSFFFFFKYMNNFAVGQFSMMIKIVVLNTTSILPHVVVTHMHDSTQLLINFVLTTEMLINYTVNFQLQNCPTAFANSLCFLTFAVRPKASSLSASQKQWLQAKNHKCSELCAD